MGMNEQQGRLGGMGIGGQQTAKEVSLHADAANKTIECVRQLSAPRS